MNRGASIAALAVGFLLALGWRSSHADISMDDEPPRHIPDQKEKVYREVRSIPYPSGAIYLSKGITGAFLGGKYRNLGEDQSLYQWQGEVGYFYTPWFSAGLAYKIKAGEPNVSKQLVFNRYYANARFHLASSKVAFYVGPQLGMDNLNILSGTPDTDTLGSVIEEPIKNTNAGVGIETGLGWKFARWGGLTMGAVAEYSLVSDENSFFGNDLNLRLIPGISIDLLTFTDTLRELVPALYLTLEAQGGSLLFQRGQKDNDRAFMLGVGLAF